MKQSPPRPFSHSEHAVTGMHLVGTTETPRIRLDAERIGPEAVLYSVTSPLPLGRLAISQLLTAPLGESAAEWRTVEKGLRDISYPSRTIKRLHRSPAEQATLKQVRPACKELADILSGNQDYMARTVTLPVFTEAQAATYAGRELERLPSVELMSSLTRFDDDPATYQRLQLIAGAPSSDTILPGLDADDQRLIQNRVMFSEASGLAYVEVLHGVFGDLFLGLREEPVFKNAQFEGGSADTTVFIRRQDVPPYLQERIHDDRRTDVRVVVGPELRDKERPLGKQTELARHKVTFFSRQHAVVAQPRISWVNDGTTRRFAFPLSHNEPFPLHPVIARSSSLVGAALAASYFGVPQGVNYEKALHRLTNKHSKYAAPLARAGLLALVLHTDQEMVLNDPYFAAIEARAVQYLHE